MKPLFLLLIMSFNFAYSQIDTSVWYPLEIGNKWQFNTYMSILDINQHNIEVIGDTLINGKNYYKIKDGTHIKYQRLEDNEKVWEFNKGTNLEYIRYDFKSPDKSIWNIDTNKNAWQYGVWGTFQDYIMIYGDTLESKAFNFAFIDSNFSPPDTMWDTMVDGLAIIISKGLGITYIGQGINAVDFVGAIINGAQIGYISEIKETQNKISLYVLVQNYPNPFNPTTTIEYMLPKDDHVKLNVFDLLGNKVASLVNEIQKKGNYKIKFDGSNLASGVYLYRLESGNFSQTKKLILLK